MKKISIFILCLCLFLVACSNEVEKVDGQTNSEKTEKSILSLVKEINNYEANKDYTQAIEVYEELGDLTNNNYEKEKGRLKEKEKAYKNDIRIVNEIKEHFDEALFNPESLQLHKIYINKSSIEDEDYKIFIDYSAMNKMGGFAREYLDWDVKNNVLQNFTQIDAEQFKQYMDINRKYNSNSDSYEFDKSLIKDL